MDLRVFRRVFQTPFIISLVIFLSVMGPGIITANVDNDAGGITTIPWLVHSLVIV